VSLVRFDDTPRAGSPLVVGVGASAGGLDAFRRLLRAVDQTEEIALVLVQHLDPSRESRLVELLEGHGAMRIEAAADDVQLQPGTAYVVPPRAVARVRAGRLELVSPPLEVGARTIIDELFFSLAEHAAPRAAGILLSGAGSDGVAGLRDLRAAGGLTIAQDPETATQTGMPREAIRVCAAELVLSIEQMPAALSRFAALPEAVTAPVDVDVPAATDRGTIRIRLDDEAFVRLAEVLGARADFDVSQYKPGTVERRVVRRASLGGFETFDAYLEHLRRHEGERRELARDLLIHVTRYFRDPEAFDELEQTVLDPMVRGARAGETLRVWVPGASTGEEAYSIAMRLLEVIDRLGARVGLQVFATDPDDGALSVGRRGLYPPAIAEHVSAERLERFFTNEGEQGFRVRPRLREAISFAVHDLTKHPPFARMHLVSCRNVLIYLRAHAQARVVRVLHFALRPAGVLWLGSNESVGSEGLFTPISKRARIFRKVGVFRPLPDRPVPWRPEPEAEARPSRSGDPDREAASRAELSRAAILRTRVPPTVIVGEVDQIVFMHGELGPYLRFPEGEPRRDLSAYLREDLATRTRAALHRCRRTGETVTAMSRPEGPFGRQTCITASPAPDVGADAVVLTFEAVEPASEPLDVVEAGPHDAVVDQLERELAATREDLRNTVEQLESANEELRAANEESMSMNEELQSANEELEATSEELRSLNEELTSVNQRLQHKVQELEGANDDLVNFFASTKLATVFLDAGLRVKRYTPAAADLLALETSTVGHRVTDVPRELLQVDLEGDAESVLRHLEPIRRELEWNDRWFARTVLPYQTGSRHIGGVVVTLSDITELRTATERLAEREARQVVLARLGMQALEESDFGRFAGRAVREVQQVLQTDYCKILECTADGRSLLLRAGVGWKDGLVGNATMDLDLDSQAGFTLQAGEPVIMRDLAQEKRFTGPALLHEHGVTSGISCVIGSGDGVYGVLGAHTRSRRDFTPDDVAFLEAVAEIVSKAVERRQARLRMTMEAAVAKVLSESGSLDEAARGIHQAMAKTLGTSLGELWWPTADEEALVCTVSTTTDDDRGMTLDVENLRLRRGEGVIGRVWARGAAETIVLAEEGSGFVRAEAAQAVGLVSGLGLPIISGGRTLGVLAVFGRMRFVADPSFLRSLDWIGRATGELVRRLQAESTTRDREERLRDVFENVGVSVWEIDFSGVREALERLRAEGVNDVEAHLEANPGLVERLLATMDVLQVNTETLRLFSAASLAELVEGLERIFVPESWSAFVQVLSAFAQGTRSLAVETRLGTLRDVSIDCTLSVRLPPPLGTSQRALLSIMDTTAIGKARAELEESRRWFKSLTEATPDIVSVYDVLADRIVYANRETVHVLGYAPEELRAMGTGVAEQLVHPDELEGVQRFYRSLGRVESATSLASRSVLVDESTYRVRHRNGTWRWIQARAVPFRTRDDGQVREALVVARDITELKRVEEELREAARQKDEYLAMLGHELRNPLAAVRSATELMKLRVTEEDPGQRRIHDILDRQTGHMAKLLDGLLDVSRIVRGKIELDSRRLSWVEVLEGAVADRGEEVHAKGLELVTDFPTDPLWIDGDRVRLVQIVDNLLSNAITHTSAPGTITVSARQEDGEAIVQVRDTGSGIDPELLPHIFETFRQAGQSIDRAKGGLGLGLALVKGLVELHGGHVTAHSEGVDHGSTFELRLPLAAPAPEARSRAPTRHDARRILVVEDNQDAAELLARLLEHEGHRVWSAQSGAEGLELAQEIRPDVVLCDLGLPGSMNGFDVARALRRHETLRDALLIAITGYGRPEDKQRTGEAGFDAHITKPVDMAELKALL
jgi:two-component system, chemotaxis family, CheB/CheR fusion protein